MELSKDQKDFYETTRSRCRQEVDQINSIIKTEYDRLTSEIKRINELIQTLESRKQVIGQMYAGAARAAPTSRTTGSAAGATSSAT